MLRLASGQHCLQRMGQKKSQLDSLTLLYEAEGIARKVVGS